MVGWFKVYDGEQSTALVPEWNKAYFRLADSYEKLYIQSKDEVHLQHAYINFLKAVKVDETNENCKKRFQRFTEKYTKLTKKMQNMADDVTVYYRKNIESVFGFS